MLNASTSTPGSRTNTPTRLTTISPISAATLAGSGPDRKADQLKPSSSCDDVAVALPLRVPLAAARPPAVLRPPALLLLLPLLPDGAGGLSVTLGCVSVSGSVACTSTRLPGLPGASSAELGPRMRPSLLLHRGAADAAARMRAARWPLSESAMSAAVALPRACQRRPACGRTIAGRRAVIAQRASSSGALEQRQQGQQQQATQGPGGLAGDACGCC